MKFGHLLRVVSKNFFKGAATSNIIYQMNGITVNIYDILIYHEWHFKEKEKEPKRKRIDIRVNIFINNIYILINVVIYLIIILYIIYYIYRIRKKIY